MRKPPCPFENLIGDPGVIYRELQEWPGYAFGDDGSAWTGKVRGRNNTGNWRKLKQYIDWYGYPQLKLCTARGRSRTVKVHTLILEAFVGICPHGKCACHNDGNSANNRLSNLRWDTQESNMADKHIHGTMLIGSRHPRSLLNESQVVEIIQRRDSGESLKSIGESYGVSDSLVCKISKNRRWKHLVRGVLHVKRAKRKTKNSKAKRKTDSE